MTHQKSNPFSNISRKTIGWWAGSSIPPQTGGPALRNAIMRISDPVFLIDHKGEIAVGSGGTITIGELLPEPTRSTTKLFPLLAFAPPLHPRDLGNRQFKKSHHLQYAYIAGAMANGITSVEMVKEMGRAGMLAFFGAGGLGLNEIEAAINSLQQDMADNPFGFNLIHSPQNPDLEAGTVDLYLQKGIKLISASAYLDLTPYLVYFRVSGIRQDSREKIICPNSIFAKVSRVEVATKFLSPPPPKILTDLVARKWITRHEAELAAHIPVADTLTAEADSGGHTDNRPAITLLPTMLALRDKMVKKHGYTESIHIGLAGGIATPDSAAAAFAMGADYILTGSINQPCTEAGTSDAVRSMLAEAMQADVTMSPSADMFEMGVKVQVLKRGTMFPLRAAKLYDLYCRYDNYEMIPAKQKEILERDIFRRSFQDEWSATKKFFTAHDPKQIDLAEINPKQKMALVFRSYLGRSSNWANRGEPSRKIDYQIWCGPALGAFNTWAKGSFLENSDNRKTVTIALNLLLGAAARMRLNMLRTQGAELPPGIERFSPMTMAEMDKLINL